MTTIIQIHEYQYPIGWEWLHNVPLEDWQWLIDILSTVTDTITPYEYATFLKNDGSISKKRTDWVPISNEEWGSVPNHVNKVDTQGLAQLMNDDQGYEGGIREYGLYIAAKTLGIKSEDEYLSNFDRIQQICNR